MELEAIFDTAVSVSAPPPGAVNVRIGHPIEGPGGRWIPCATALTDQSYVPCVFEVGVGRKQVCAPHSTMMSVDAALTLAVELAETAAA